LASGWRRRYTDRVCQAGVDARKWPEMSSEEPTEIKRLERENAELRRE
jgi:transposase-like protein